MSDQNWEGVPNTSEHRTAGGRAWCFNDSEWCYPKSLCQCCDVTRVPDQWKGMYAGEVLADLRARVEALPLAWSDSGGFRWIRQADVLALLGGDDD